MERSLIDFAKIAEPIIFKYGKQVTAAKKEFEKELDCALGADMTKEEAQIMMAMLSDAMKD